MLTCFFYAVCIRFLVVVNGIFICMCAKVKENEDVPCPGVQNSRPTEGIPRTQNPSLRYASHSAATI